MISSFAEGYRYGISGLAWLLRPGIRTYVAAPILVNAIVFSLGVIWVFDFIGGLQAMAEAWLPDWLDWLTWLLWPITLVAVLVIVWSGFTMLANLIGSPFNGLLSERVQREHAPDLAMPSLSPLVEALKAPLFELVKIGYFLILAIPPIILSFIPLLNILAPFAWALYGAWILAVEYCDYPMGNGGIRLSEQRSRLRADPMLALGFGAGVMTLTVIPVLNLVAMPAAVIGATLIWCDRLARRRDDI